MFSSQIVAHASLIEFSLGTLKSNSRWCWTWQAPWKSNDNSNGCWQRQKSFCCLGKRSQSRLTLGTEMNDKHGDYKTWLFWVSILLNLTKDVSLCFQLPNLGAKKDHYNQSRKYSITRTHRFINTRVEHHCQGRQVSNMGRVNIWLFDSPSFWWMVQRQGLKRGILF